jgi:hypothetical protein
VPEPSICFEWILLGFGMKNQANVNGGQLHKKMLLKSAVLRFLHGEMNNSSFENVKLYLLQIRKR